MSGMDVVAVRLPVQVEQWLDAWRAGRVDEEGREVSRSAAVRIWLVRAMRQDMAERGHHERHP
jgi:Arc/MetJ-type ribon-helix-helix transcriptional regulator